MKNMTLTNYSTSTHSEESSKSSYERDETMKSSYERDEKIIYLVPLRIRRSSINL